MKILSIAIPCYNSEAYMENCVKSLLPGGKDVEIIIVNDGSTDNTPEIAEELAAEYPGIVKVVHKENGGHGSAINYGLDAACGKFFKVVDSDDWVDLDAYLKILKTLRRIHRAGRRLDLLISNFVYDKQDTGKTVMSYRGLLPEGRIFRWKDARHPIPGKYILMHSVIYRTKILKDAHIQMPEHTFYVDNLFVFEPLPYVKRLYYLNVDFYHYFIGRADQSVNEEVMIKRIDQQLYVNRRMVDYITARKERIKARKKLWLYMMHYLDIVTTISVSMALRSGTEENLKKREELWAYIRDKDEEIYRKLRFSP
ncbi:MAG: glycosyltransferase family 2 protein, partial [Lachnospiraceae bacterium]|nr:glycosyltransferase family 2 protein [Lachnospiraceae bacterium]